jgi:hypothetical protein
MYIQNADFKALSIFLRLFKPYGQKHATVEVYICMSLTLAV